MDTKKPLKFVFRDERKFISGTKFISQKDQTITSSGIISLDFLTGGGLQLGSILLIDHVNNYWEGIVESDKGTVDLHDKNMFTEEDEFAVFSKYFIKYFLAEGLCCKHPLYVGCLDYDARKLVLDLPSPVDYSEPATQEAASDLKIAWRYKNTPQVQSVAGGSTSGATFGHNFDLTSPCSKETVESAQIAYWPPKWPMDQDCTDPYTSLLQDLRERLAKTNRSVLRIAVPRLGSPLWPRPDKHLPRFLYCLRHLVRAANASAVVTIPGALLEPATVGRCEHQCDNVISLLSLANNGNPAYKDYSGLLTVVKLASMNTLTAHVPDTRDWAFKLRRRRFVIEKLHLPPELAESAQREGVEEKPSCSSASSSSKLDF